VIDPDESNLRMRARELAGDLARAAAEIRHARRPDDPQSLRRQRREAPDRQVPRIREGKRIVLVRGEKRIVEFTVGAPRPPRRPPPEAPKKTADERRGTKGQD
jgi:hypothetical protein